MRAADLLFADHCWKQEACIFAVAKRARNGGAHVYRLYPDPDLRQYSL